MLLSCWRSSDDMNWKWSRSRFDPCRLFLRFLESGCWDHTLLIDLLMSPETCFLIYITRLLKHIVSDWEHWMTVCRNTDDDKEEEEEETAALSADALVVDLSRDTANSSHNNTSSVDEFENAYQSVEMKRSSCVQRFQPMSSLKQLDENYTSLLSESSNLPSNILNFQYATFYQHFSIFRMTCVKYVQRNLKKNCALQVFLCALISRPVCTRAQFRPAVLNLFRLADHLTNFVSVRGPPKNVYIFSGKFQNF